MLNELKYQKQSWNVTKYFFLSTMYSSTPFSVTLHFSSTTCVITLVTRYFTDYILHLSSSRSRSPGVMSPPADVRLQIQADVWRERLWRHQNGERSESEPLQVLSLWTSGPGSAVTSSQTQEAVHDVVLIRTRPESVLPQPEFHRFSVFGSLLSLSSSVQQNQSEPPAALLSAAVWASFSCFCVSAR